MQKRTGRLTLLFNSKEDLYNQNEELVDIKDDGTVIINKENIVDGENEILVQNKTTLTNLFDKIGKQDIDNKELSNVLTKNYRITLKNTYERDDNNFLIEPFLSKGLNIYEYDLHETGNEQYTNASFNNYLLLDKLLKKYDIQMIFAKNKNYDILIQEQQQLNESDTEKDRITSKVEISEYYYLENKPPFVEMFQIDEDHFNDIGFFYIDSERLWNLINFSGLTCKQKSKPKTKTNSDVLDKNNNQKNNNNNNKNKKNNQNSLQCNKTSFWYSQLFTNHKRLNNDDLDEQKIQNQETKNNKKQQHHQHYLDTMDYTLKEPKFDANNGLHPQFIINAKKYGNRFAKQLTPVNEGVYDNTKQMKCDYYLYLDLPNQIFLNKFDSEFENVSNELSPTNITTTSYLELIAQIGDSDLEKPDYQLPENGKTLNLIKLHMDQNSPNTTFHFNLHKRYINPVDKTQITPITEKFQFDSYIFQKCPLDFENKGNPFVKKNYGSLLDNFLLSNNDKYFVDMIHSNTFQFTIPAPDINEYSNIYLWTWSIIGLSIAYLFYKMFSKETTPKKNLSNDTPRSSNDTPRSPNDTPRSSNNTPRSS